MSKDGENRKRSPKNEKSSRRSKSVDRTNARKDWLDVNIIDCPTDNSCSTFFWRSVIDQSLSNCLEINVQFSTCLSDQKKNNRVDVLQLGPLVFHFYCNTSVILFSFVHFYFCCCSVRNIDWGNDSSSFYEEHFFLIFLRLLNSRKNTNEFLSDEDHISVSLLLDRCEQNLVVVSLPTDSNKITRREDRGKTTHLSLTSRRNSSSNQIESNGRQEKFVFNVENLRRDCIDHLNVYFHSLWID